MRNDKKSKAKTDEQAFGSAGSATGGVKTSQQLQMLRRVMTKQKCVP
jgi:hypothetical protein